MVAFIIAVRNDLKIPMQGEVRKASVMGLRAMLEAAQVPQQCNSVDSYSRKSRSEDHKIFNVPELLHINDHQSAAMWRLYAKNDEGIAIKSSVKQLADSMNKCKYPIFLGEVGYIDFEKDNIPHGNVLIPFLYKRHGFDRERELRAISWLPTMFSSEPAIEGEDYERRIERVRRLFNRLAPVELNTISFKSCTWLEPHYLGTGICSNQLLTNTA